MNIISQNPDDTRKLGRTIARELKGGEVLCLYGELGAGKTTFAQGFIDFFLPQKRVLSPTFIIVRHYLISHKLIKNIYHVDLYRIASIGDIAGLGLTELMYKPDSIVLVEWAERLGNLLPKKRIDIKFSIINEKEREIDIRIVENNIVRG